MRRRPTQYRVHKLVSARRAQMLEAGRAYRAGSDMTHAEAVAIVEDMDPVVAAAMETLSEADLVVMCAPGATSADFAHLPLLVIRALLQTDDLSESERAAVLALPPAKWH